MKLPPQFQPSTPSTVAKPPAMLLARINLKRTTVLILKDAADRESAMTGRRVTVSDLVRDAVREWLQLRNLTP